MSEQLGDQVGYAAPLRRHHDLVYRRQHSGGQRGDGVFAYFNAAIDRAIGMVDAKRSYLGATENRLESVIAGNQSTEIHLNQARSRIVDADYAVETANLTKFQILQQASTSMLAQANQTPQQVLRLLGQAVG